MRGGGGFNNVVPPVPPKKSDSKERKVTHIYGIRNSQERVGGAGLNAVRVRNSSIIAESSYDHCDQVVIGQSVDIRGHLYSAGLVRVAGNFEGVMKCDGDLIVADTGKLLIVSLEFVPERGDGQSMEGMNYASAGRHMLVQGGKVEGHIDVGELSLYGKSDLKGSVCCKSMRIKGSDVQIEARINIQRTAPVPDEGQAGEVQDEVGEANSCSNGALIETGVPTLQDIIDNAMREYMIVKSRRKIAKDLTKFTLVTQSPKKTERKQKKKKKNKMSPDKNSRSSKTPTGE